MIYFELKKDQGSDDNILQVEKENPNLITVFICFLRSGLRFTRYDTNNVGLAFIEEIKKHNPNFKAEKVQQRERDQIYTVNAFPKEFEPLINSLIEEYRIKHKLEYRLKKPRSGGGRSGGSYNRQGGGRQGGYNQSRDNRGSGYSGQRRDGQSQGNYSRPRRDDQGGGYNQRRENSGSRDGSYRPRRNYNEQPGRDNPRRSNDDQQSGYRPQRSNYSQPRRPLGNSDENKDQGSKPEGDQNFNREGYVPRYTRDKSENGEEKRPRRPRKDTNE